MELNLEIYRARLLETIKLDSTPTDPGQEPGDVGGPAAPSGEGGGPGEGAGGG